MTTLPSPYPHDALLIHPIHITLPTPLLPALFLPLLAVPHLHGAHVQSTSDGNPDAWFTSRGATGFAYASSTYTYPNQQPAATLWYHDHTMGMTRLNVEAGLFGAFLLTDSALEAKLNLPSGEFDVPLVFQDKSFTWDGGIFKVQVGDNPGVHPNWVPESFNTYQTVNGKVSSAQRVVRCLVMDRSLMVVPSHVFLQLESAFTELHLDLLMQSSLFSHLPPILLALSFFR